MTSEHTLFVANDNDYVTFSGGVENPNRFFVFSFTDGDLPGYVAQPVKPRPFLDCSIDTLAEGCLQP